MSRYRGEGAVGFGLERRRHEERKVTLTRVDGAGSAETVVSFEQRAQPRDVPWGHLDLDDDERCARFFDLLRITLLE